MNARYKNKSLPSSAVLLGQYNQFDLYYTEKHLYRIWGETQDDWGNIGINIAPAEYWTPILPEYTYAIKLYEEKMPRYKNPAIQETDVFLGRYDSGERKYDLYFRNNEACEADMLRVWGKEICDFSYVSISAAYFAEIPEYAHALNLIEEKRLLKMEPRYKHEKAKGLIFLGQYKEYDLYFENKEGEKKLHRFWGEGNLYGPHHGWSFGAKQSDIPTYPEYIHAWTLAEEKGLVATTPYGNPVTIEDSILKQETTEEVTFSMLKKAKSLAEQTELDPNHLKNLVEKLESLTKEFGGMARLIQTLECLAELS